MHAGVMLPRETNWNAKFTLFQSNQIPLLPSTTKKAAGINQRLYLPTKTGAALGSRTPCLLVLRIQTFRALLLFPAVQPLHLCGLSNESLFPRSAARGSLQ